MGAVCSSPQSTDADKSLVTKSKDIDKTIAAESKKGLPFKVLILGTGESGKSTLLKQMRIIYDQGFSPKEREEYRQIVFRNLAEGLTTILSGLERLNVEVSDEIKQKGALIAKAPELKEGDPFPVEYKQLFKDVWADPTINAADKYHANMVWPESIKFFMSEIDVLFNPTYVPSDAHCLRVRWSTTGLIEMGFKIGLNELRVVDVGGQRSERRKWIHAFNEVTALLYVTSLAGYDTVLAEATEANQMQESLILFAYIANSKWFATIPIILFFNKYDMFLEKVKGGSDIRIYHPDYPGDHNDPEAIKNWFVKRFINSRQSDASQMYIYTTTATDTNMLRTVMKVVTDIILRQKVVDALL